MNDPKPFVSVSIVSHGQTAMVERLLDKMEQHHDGVDLEVILTENILPSKPIATERWDFLLRTINNTKPHGLAANHNQAFKISKGKYFCLVNPDVVFVESIFIRLIKDIEEGLGEITAPLIVNNSGVVQDSFRPLPSPWALFKRLLFRNNHQLPPISKDTVYPDWIAGIFLCMRSETFKQLGGMDERYYLYFEDVDLCCRARLENLRPLLDTRVQAIHEAGRHSRKNLRYFLMHLQSAVRFFCSRTYKKARAL